MDTNILCTLLARQIPPEQFQVRGLEVHWMSEEYNTPENNAELEYVIANYETLAAEHEAKQEALRQIAVLESQQTPRRVRESVAGIDNGWMKNIESQISVLRAQLK